MRRWTAGCLWVVLAVILAGSSTPADPILGSTTWVATETTTEATATTQIYTWSFVGPTDFTLVDTYSFFSPPFVTPAGNFDFSLTNNVLSGVTNGNILGIPFPDDGTVIDALFILTGTENFFRRGCSVSDFPPCERAW